MSAETNIAAEPDRKKVIFVDDVKLHLLAAKDRLKKHYKVFTAQSVETMFEILSRIRPDIILLDVNMPEMDGYQAIKQIKANPGYAGIPVVFLSSQVDRESIIKGIKLGAADFITKPYTDSELVKSIEYQLNPQKRGDEDRPIILAVDDNPSVLKSIHYLLKDTYKVYTLTEPGKIKELLLKIPAPDLFLLDIDMPVASGFDLIKVIRGYTIHKDTPVIILTSTGTVDNITVAANLGACDFMVKPVEDAVLCEKLEHHLKDFIMLRRIRALNAPYEVTYNEEDYL